MNDFPNASAPGAPSPRDLAYDRRICGAVGADHATPTPMFTESTIYMYRNSAEFGAALRDPWTSPVYQRLAHPAIRQLEDPIAELERAEDAVCFGSGMAAIAAVIMQFARSDSSILTLGDIYAPLRQLLESLRPLGVSHVALDEAAAFEPAVLAGRPVSLVYVETPSTLTLRLHDFEKVIALARELNAVVAVDNTCATPLRQKPLRHGVDLVIHSLSKYVSGHSDALGGAVAGRAELIDGLRREQLNVFGAAMAPATATRIIRGLRTLPTRLAAQEDAAESIAQFLADHPLVAGVNYPGLPGAPDRSTFEQQMSGGSGLISFRLSDPSVAAVRRFVDALRVFRLAVSWGGFESLAYSPALAHEDGGVVDVDTTIRLSIGLEGHLMLIDDLVCGLESTSHDDANPSPKETP